MSKIIDTNVNITNITTTPTVTLLNGVALGSDETNRVGRKIWMEKLCFNWGVFPEDTATDITLWRFIIAYDAQANSAAPAWLDLMKETSTLSQYNNDNVDRFSILLDTQGFSGKQQDTATQAMSNSPTTFTNQEELDIDALTIFSGTGATVASISTGSLYLFYMASGTAGTSSDLIYSSRVYFNDS